MLSEKDMCVCIDVHTHYAVFVYIFSVLLCVCVLLFLRICMMVVLGCTHCLLPTKRVTDDTESQWAGAGATQKTFTEKKIPIFFLSFFLSCVE